MPIAFTTGQSKSLIRSVLLRRLRLFDTLSLILIAHPQARRKVHGQPAKVTRDGARQAAFAWPFEQAHVGLRQKVRSACANERISALSPFRSKVSEKLVELRRVLKGPVGCILRDSSEPLVL